ncbi:MAG: M3 family metallopeptidase [Bacteroidales bacterium]|nr:M3 family metallopeptidase [Bacteroidales bacterium]
MKSKNESDNPFYTDYNTPFQVPAFDKIKNQHYLPAIEEGIRQQEKEVENIVSNQDEPDFANTIEALEKTGRMLDNVTSVFYNQNSANTNEEIQEIAKQIAPLLSKLQDDILMNEELFNKVKIVNDRKDQLSLSPEQNKLLEETYKSFVRGGANLSDEDKNKLRKINEELSILSLRFGENVLAETNDYKLVIEDEENLAGLPESVVAGASEAAKEAGLEGKWVFTLHKPSMIPFLQFSKKRDLREKIFKAYYSRGDNNNNYDNKEVLSKMANLRLERAKLLGYESHAAFILSDNMAKEPKNVYQLLDRLWDAALPNAKAEAAELQKLIDKEGGDFKLASWDWWYYAEKLKKEKYDLDEESLRPYFQLNNVIDGVFYVVNKLYGLTFVPRTDIPTYQEDVKVFEVQEANGSHIGILYMDFFPRSSKRAGAWMSSYRKQRFDGETKITPVITNVFNFSKPTEGKPALLSLEEVTTTFHEFGHALHGLLSNCKYNSLSGTSVARDFVELPSQIMENWATEPEVMKVYAKHYKTDEPIPDELIEKISNARFFNQGFELTEYLAASFLDMNYHTLTEPKELDVEEFETDALNQIGLIPEIIVRYRSTYFQHIFSGGYSSGYYSYIWAEVLDADAFHAFKETSLFDQSYALAFRKNILEKGGTDDPMKLYVQFRGAEPNIDPLLKRRGINL